MVMPGNHSCPMVHYWAGRYPGKIGWLIGPSAIPKTKLRGWLPFALDNDAFTCWLNGSEWNETAWVSMLERVRGSSFCPLWCLVPDVVADKNGTLEKWERHKSTVERFGWPKAFAVQDGMTPGDVPNEAEVIFVGGTAGWKWKTVKIWASNFPRVHVGRVNSVKRLWLCEEIGVESVDGTGWFRTGEDGQRIKQLQRWMDGEKDRQMQIDFSIYETTL